MKKSNSQSNNLIKWGIIFIDFLMLIFIWWMCLKYHPQMEGWVMWKIRTSLMMNLIALGIAESYFSPIVQKRVVSVGDILKRLCGLATTQMLGAFFLLKMLTHRFPCGMTELTIGIFFFLFLLIARTIERKIIKLYRSAGGNIRNVTLVGSDSELVNIYKRLTDDVTMGFRIKGYYAQGNMDVPDNIKLERLGSLDDLFNAMDQSDGNVLGDDVYVSISRRERDTIRRISKYCDQNVVRFYYVPVSVETLGMDLKREFLDDIEIFTTYENPLQNPVNKVIKRVFDILFSSLFLVFSLPIWPIVWLVMRMQSPGPLFFKQARTGLDGKDFMMYKFRSMHVNADADKIQATENDPRKYPFGNFMRKANIDELPQFWNVLKGDMSIVGPRPHMLAHTEMYSQLISKYMVRHFVKPGVTGWAQVTGFRGETKELWQMEGRVKRDIWYMEHWSVWLDIRIMWMTAKSMIIHDKHAY